jgi:sensor histidine kinase YesM
MLVIYLEMMFEMSAYKEKNQSDIQNSSLSRSHAPNSHPLEAIHFFRRWPASLARDFVYTLIFNFAIALLFTLVWSVFVNDLNGTTLLNMFWRSLAIGNVFGFTFWLVMMQLRPLIAWLNQQPYLVMLTLLIVLGLVLVTAAFFVLSFFPGFYGLKNAMFSRAQLSTNFFIAVVSALVLSTIWRRRNQELEAQQNIAQEKERAKAAQLSAVQANLRALQAQIEPHFLFNTLSNVLSLIDTQPDLAKSMLEKFTFYLRSSLDATRTEQTSFAQEFLLMEQFLDILKVRMGERLRVKIALSDELRLCQLPPMLLQPMIENAIQHGIEPKVEGGEIELTAHRDNERALIRISDTGIGFRNPRAAGLGLKNVRERIARIYDGKGSLRIEENPNGGTCVTIELPYVPMVPTVPASH